MADAVITRSFPVSSLIKEKRLAGLSSKDVLWQAHRLHDGLQLRSSTFQLIKIYFDEEVSADRVDRFRSELLRLRYPQSVSFLFLFFFRLFDV